MRPPYKYRPLEPNTIRLLRILPDSQPDDIQCELVHFPTEGTDYTALFYCWGDPKPAAHIRVDDQDLSVASNLLRFLVCHITEAHVRPDMYTFLWIDAVCIDQKNLEEKSAQVRIMWSIYERAKQVTAWLGDVAPPVERVLTVAGALGKIVQFPSYEPGDCAITVSLEQVESACLTCGYQNKDELLSDIACLTDHDYFQRMWTYQEVMVAARDRNICFKTASSGHSMEEVWTISETLHPLEDEGYDLSELNMNFRYLMWQWWVTQVAIKSKWNVSSPGAVLYNALLNTEFRRCLDPRDRVFAVLGLPDVRAKADELKLVADYTMTPEDVFVSVLLRFEELSMQYRLSAIVSNSDLDSAEELEEHPSNVGYLAVRLMNALKLDRYYDSFHDFWTHVRSQHKIQNMFQSQELPVIGGILMAHTWLMRMRSSDICHEGYGEDSLLRAVHRHFQRIEDSLFEAMEGVSR